MKWKWRACQRTTQALLCILLIVHSQRWTLRQFFPKQRAPSEHVRENKRNLTPQGPPPWEDKSPLHLLLRSLVSVWREQPNNSVFLSSSWKTTCSMFLLCKAAMNESRRTAKRLLSLQQTQLAFLLRLVAKHRGRKGDGARPVRDGVVCLRTPSPRHLCHFNAYLVQLRVTLPVLQADRLLLQWTGCSLDEFSLFQRCNRQRVKFVSISCRVWQVSYFTNFFGSFYVIITSSEQPCTF